MHSKLRYPSQGVRSPTKNYDSSYYSNATGAHSEHLRKMMEEDVEMYPAGFSQLLRHEERNLRAFKKQLSREKERIDEDMSAFRIEMNHTLEDLRLSLHAQLDRVYQDYMQRYAKFKGEIFEINRLKDQIEIEYPTHAIRPKNDSHSLSSSNLKTISQMEHGSRQIKKMHFLNYVSQLQKQRILPLNDLQREIVILTEYSNGFYQPEEFKGILVSLKSFLNQQIAKIYTNKHLYIREADSILFKQESRLLDQIEPDRNFRRNRNCEQIRAVNDNRTYQTRVMQNDGSRYQGQGQETKLYGKGSPIYGAVGPTQQAVKVEWAENLNVVETNKIELDRPQAPLCGISINNYLVMGMKDGSLVVCTAEGKHVKTLKEHTASVCTLAILKMRGQEFLASGADHGCSRILIWNPSNWQVVQRYQQHVAAVTTIVDLKDNCHFLSGGYDKRINVYSFEQARLVFNLPANQTSVAGAVVNKSGSRVVTCGLDKSLNVWQVSRLGQQVETMFLQRKIQNNVLICSMSASSMLDELVIIGTKDGKIKMINIEKGESYKTLHVGDANIIQLVLIERASKQFYPFILAWPYKESKLHLINSETSAVSTKQWNGYLEFGCGIGPKAFLWQKGARLTAISHAENSRAAVSEFRIQELS